MDFNTYYLDDLYQASNSIVREV